MYYLLALLSGVIISAMVTVNGGLTDHYGLYTSTLIIHLVGLLVITIITVTKFRSLRIPKVPWFLLSGGAVGVLTVLFNNIAFGRISISSLLALGLFGQTIAAMLIDQFGLFGMNKEPFQWNKLFGLFLIAGGIIAMTNTFEPVAVIVSLLSGVTIVVSRTTNAKLGERSSVLHATFMNYVLGTIVMLAVFPVLGRGEQVFSAADFSAAPWLYLGGIFGMAVVLLSNVVVVKISAFFVTLLAFAGQVFSGIVIDALMFDVFSSQILIGGVLVTLGLVVNLILDQRSRRRPADA
jgi:transporter family-2 protein